MRARYDTLLRNLSTLIFAGVLLIGVPIALIALVGWPLPTNLPSVDQIQLALRSGIDPTLLINTLAIIVWIAWAQLVAAIVAESVAAARGKTARSLPVLPGFQPVAAQIVAAVTLVVATFGPIRPPPATAAPLAPTFAEPVSQTLVLQPDPQEPPPPASQTPTRPDTAPLPTYEVKHFDTFWSVADTTLGDGRRWQEIRDLNIGRSDAAGEPITPVTEHVTPGTTLTLPANATIPTAPATAPPAASRTTTDSTSQRDHVVGRGDNLWSIAEATLVDAWGRQPTSAEIVPYWQELIETNRDRLTPLYDPNLIYPDQILSLPSEPTDQHPVESSNEGRPTAASNEMVVERGDNLWSIAETALTDAWGRQPTSTEVASYWQGVIETNRDRLQAPDDPNFIYPWQTLEIPQTPPDPTLTTADDPTIPEVGVDATDTPASTAGEAPDQIV